MASSNWSFTKEEMQSNAETQQNLVEAFRNVIDEDIIHNVAFHCNYDLNKSYATLWDISGNNNQNTPSREIPPAVASYASMLGSPPLLKDDDDDDVVLVSETLVNPLQNHTPFPYKVVKKVPVVEPKSKKEQEFDRAVLQVRQGTLILILMRGLPGSGKSYLARQIVNKGIGENHYSTFILSADDYFINRRTKAYEYEPRKLSQAHEWNHQRAYTSMSRFISPVIIDNTNVEAWEMKPYVCMAVNFGYTIEVLEPFTHWAFNDKELARRNSHNVARVKIKDMLDRYQKNLTVPKLMALWNLSYSDYAKPPILRKYPPVQFNVPYNNIENDNTKAVGEESPSKLPVNLLSLNLPETPAKDSSTQDLMSFDDCEAIAPPLPPDDKTPKAEKHVLPCSSNSERKKSRTSSKSVREVNQARNLYPKLNLASWGLPDDAVTSWSAWDVVCPLRESQAADSAAVQDDDVVEFVKETRNATTNTSSADFGLEAHPDSVRVLTGHNRNICEGMLMQMPPSLSKIALLDKGCMADLDDLLDAVSDEEKHLQDLIALFPDFPEDSLRDVYEKCRRDLNWTVDLLLDDRRELLPVRSEPKIGIQQNLQNLPTESGSSSSAAGERILSPAASRGEKSRMDKREMQELKRQFEEKFEIDTSRYSEHLLKIQNQKRGRHGSTCDYEAIATSVGDVIMAASSSADLDHYEGDMDYFEDDDEMMELNLGEGLITQLETKFGFPEMFPQGFLPVVHVPIALARQLHALYVESVLVQMDNQNQVLEMIVKEDEELARKLQAQDEQGNQTGPTMHFQEIMDEQMAVSLYRREADEWKKLTPDNLAAKLTRQKLYSAFPTIDRSSLDEILHAHDSSYKDTVEILLASTDRDKVFDPEGTILEPPISQHTLDDMKKAEEETQTFQSLNAVDSPKSANDYRLEASAHLQKHKELIQKAQLTYQSHQYQVAQFYSDLAKTHTQLYNQANSRAASAFLQDHSKRLQNFNTLDLHYLYVKEALAALDMFLDTNIQLLQGSIKKCENLFIITGRGKRSEQGRSRIKPAVMARLRKRSIWYVEINPGLLKIRVRPHSLVTSSVP